MAAESMSYTLRQQSMVVTRLCVAQCTALQAPAYTCWFKRVHQILAYHVKHSHALASERTVPGTIQAAHSMAHINVTTKSDLLFGVQNLSTMIIYFVSVRYICTHYYATIYYFPATSCMKGFMSSYGHSQRSPKGNTVC